jgi:TIR domain-containing protein/carboxypeptidase family protein
LLVVIGRRLHEQTMVNKSHSSHPLQIFLCHSSDDKTSIQELYKRLCDDGFKPWLDEEDLLPGQNWHQAIMRAVRDSDVVVVCLSRNSVNKRGYVQKEIKLALDVADEQPEDTIFIIPLKLEECDVPTRLKQWHWVNLFEDRGYERLITALRHRAAGYNEPLPRLGKETNKDKPKLITQNAQPTPSYTESFIGKGLLRIVLILTISVVTLITGYWNFIYKPSHSNTINSVQYAGRVKDASTLQVIQGAKVSLEIHGVPQTYYTNTDGVFFLKLPETIGVVHIRVEADGYEIFERNVTFSTTETEDIRLVSSVRISTPSPIATGTPASTPTPVRARPERKPQQTDQSKREDPALDILRGIKKDKNLNRRN